MTGGLRGRLASPGVAAVAAVALTLGGLLIGIEPVGGDPDRLYRPIKVELARALREGSLPFWSDRFGLGVPLVAESHVAAFYPPNWLLYGTLEVSTAYRLSMWLHYVALAGVTYAYARRLGVQPWGSALSALAFSLCGFQAIHSSHEPLYSALPFLVLALYLAEDAVAKPQVTALALLALTWAAQLTLGHFQIAAWTAGLVLVTGAWRCLAEGHPRQRVIALLCALLCGAGIAAVQLVLSWNEATLLGTTARPVRDLMFYAYPPAHWPELALPRLFTHLPGGPDGPYWATTGTSGYESCFYVGTLPLMLVFVGLATRRDRALAPWLLIVPVSFALATMPHWWPSGYALLVQVPGAGYFRAPARYTLITSLGLALLAGRGFDRAVSTRRVLTGLGVAAALGLAAAVWVLRWTARPEAALAEVDLAVVFGWSSVAWLASAVALLAWRRGWVGQTVPFLVVAVELAGLYYHSTTVWGPAVDLPRDSPVLRRLAQETEAGTVGGAIGNLPVRAGRAATYPYLGMGLPPPTSALGLAQSPQVLTDPRTARLFQRLGMAYAIWDAPVSLPGVDVLHAGPDEVLDRLAFRPTGTPDRRTWHLLRLPHTAPVHVALRAAGAPDERTVLSWLSQDDSTDTAWFLAGDRPIDPQGPRARAARIVHWDGLTGEVEHDGTCDVVIRRTYRSGWTARLDDAPPMPVSRVDAGLQGVRVTGAGRTRIALHYQPPHLREAGAVSVLSLGFVLLVLAREAYRPAGVARAVRNRRP